MHSLPSINVIAVEPYVLLVELNNKVVVLVVLLIVINDDIVTAVLL